MSTEYTKVESGKQGNPYKPSYIDEKKAIKILYLNHRGVFEWRRVYPLASQPEFKSHIGYYGDVEQWYLKCWCFERDDYRDFALLNIRDIKTLDYQPEPEPK